jgi:HAD superfamily hydrolase (TIGR01459 family)
VAKHIIDVSKPPMTVHIHGLGEIADRYDAFILDLWGCLHDGIVVYPAALEALHGLKAAGKRAIILSNAPRRAREVAARCAEMGITPDLYDRIYTSGEETWRELAQNEIAALQGRGRKLYPIIAARDRAMLDGIDVELVDDPVQADFMLVTGTETGNEDLASFDPLLAPAAARGVPLICANPDLVVHRGGVEEICAGSVAQRYEMLGGPVVWFGKPYPAVYRRILADCGLAPAQLLCVGDALRTDVAGGKGIGAATLFTVGGIHHQELLVDNRLDMARLEALCRRLGQTPDFAIAHLGW